jgi:ankyrin repeat protein
MYNAHPHTELSESVRLLVEAGAEIDAMAGPHNNRRNPLMCASTRKCCNKVLQVFLEHGADVFLPCPGYGRTPLHWAAGFGRTDSCELLLEYESSLMHARDSDDSTALLCAVGTGPIDTVKLLLSGGADVNASNSSKYTALMAACFRERIDVAGLLIEAGADINAASHEGICALTIAVQVNSAPLVQLLLNSGADINATDSLGKNALFTAAHYGHVEVMALLVQHGLSITTVDTRGTTLLMTAASEGHIPAAEWLLQHGVAVNAVGPYCTTALHSANLHSRDDVAMVELLLAYGANVHKRDTDDRTVLSFAALKGNLECVRVLIGAGADVNSAESGMTSLHVAVAVQHSAVAQLLLEHGAVVVDTVIPFQCQHGAGCCTSMTALMMCSKADTVKVLLAAGADVHVTNHAGNTCLHLAAQHGLPAPVVCLFIKAGADLHAVNRKGKTAAQLAHDKGHTLIEQLLNRAAQQQETLAADQQ